MALTFLDAVDFTKVPALGFVVPVVAADPGGYEAGLIYNSTSKEVKYHNGTTWVALGPAGAGGPPTGAASGDLTGSYPSPQIATGVIVDADVNASAAIATSKISGLDTALANRAVATRNLIAGTGLTGGGDLTTDRTFNVGAGTGITVNADDVALNTTYADGRYVLVGGATMTGLLTLSGDPSSNLHAATKQYVDITSQGFSFKQAVRVVATTNQATSGLLTIDGVTLVANDRVLLAGQTTASQNGIWLAASGAWTRATDMDASGELVDGTLVPVGAGTTNADSQWMCVSVAAVPWVPNSTNSTWTKYAQLGDLIAGAGLTKTGSTVDFVGDATLTVAADQVSVASAPKWTTARSVSLTGDVTGSAASVDGTANVSIATTVVGGTKHYAGNVGSGTAVVVNHALNTRDVDVQVYRNSTPWDTIGCTVERTDVNNVTLRFATSVTASAYRCVVIGR